MVALALFVGLAFVHTTAEAHVKTFTSRVRHRSTATEGDVVTKLGGVVTSRRDRCEPGRKVVVYVGGDRYGSDTTDTNGAWEIEGDDDAGRQYRFTVYPENIGPEGHSHVCSAHTLYKVIEAP